MGMGHELPRVDISMQHMRLQSVFEASYIGSPSAESFVAMRKSVVDAAGDRSVIISRLDECYLDSPPWRSNTKPIYATRPGR